MRSLRVFAFTLVGIGLLATDAAAFGKRNWKNWSDSEYSEQIYGGMNSFSRPKAAQFGYPTGNMYPGYTAPHGYNPQLFPGGVEIDPVLIPSVMPQSRPNK